MRAAGTASSDGELGYRDEYFLAATVRFTVLRKESTTP